MKPAVIHLLLVAVVVTIFTIVAGIVVSDVTTELKRQLEPYGGCDEAHLYPGTPGAEDCAQMGKP